MEAMVGVSRGGLAGCSFHRGSFLESSSGLETKNVELPYCKRFHGRTRAVISILKSSVLFEDQSHVQFYLNNVHHAPRSCCPEPGQQLQDVGASDASVFHVYTDIANHREDEHSQQTVSKKSIKKAKKAAKKLLKRSKAGAATSSSSSSSSSSDSDAELKSSVRRGRSKRRSEEQMGRHTEIMSQSAVLETTPSKFLIGKSQAAQQYFVSPLSLSPLDNYLEEEHSHRSSPSMCASVISSSGANSEVLAIRSSSESATTPLLDDKHSIPSLAGLAVSPDILIDDDIVLLRSNASTARVEVCMGGKCKKAGAQQILSAFEANGVPAFCSNKCMKNCKAAINVRIVEDSETSQSIMYSCVGLNDVQSVSQEYFGARNPIAVLA